jgi:phosphoglycerate dehydrogenase-like enzyme
VFVGQDPAAVFAVPTSSEAAEALGGMPELEVVQVLSAGIDWVEPHVPDGVTLCNAGDARSPAVAQWVVAAILHDLGGFARGHTSERWQPRELDGKRVVIVGYGSIGRAVERRLTPFGARIGRVARSAREGVEPVERLGEAVERADVVVVLAPLSDETRGLVGADVLARMPDGALLVNAGRGPVVDTDALVDAVRAGRIRAALDVTEPEPLPDDHPLWTLDGVFLTPHSRGRHAGGRARRAGARARADAAPPRGPAAGARRSGRVQRARDALAVAPHERVAAREEREQAGERDRQAARPDRVRPVDDRRPGP